MNKASHAFIHKLRNRQEGVAAIELALIMPILLVFLTFPIFLSSVFWHYTAAHKAAQDAARYLATVPRSEMMNRSAAGAAGDLARDIVERQVSDIAAGLEMTEPDFYCATNVRCGRLAEGTLPEFVSVEFSMTLRDPFGVIDFGWYGLQMNVAYTIDYVGH